MVVIWWRAHSHETGTLDVVGVRGVNGFVAISIVMKARTRFKAERSGSFVNLARMSCWSELDLYKVVDLVAIVVDEVWDMLTSFPFGASGLYDVYSSLSLILSR
jgi:hypothetical protein